MLNELRKIADWLDQNNYKEEADQIDLVLNKLADKEYRGHQPKKQYWQVQDKITANLTDLIQNFHRAAQSLSSGQVAPDLEDEIRGELYRKIQENMKWLPSALQYSQFTVPPNTAGKLKELFGPRLQGVARRLENRFTNISELIPELESIRNSVDELSWLKEKGLVERPLPSPEQWLKTVETIYKLYGEGIGPKGIIEHLEANKMYPPRGGVWMSPAIYNLLKKPQYLEQFGHHLPEEILAKIKAKVKGK